MPLQQLAGGDGELDDVSRHACRVRAGGNFRAAAVESFQLPVIERAARDGHVVAAVAVLRFGEGLDDLRGRELVGNLREVERVAPGRVIPRKSEGPDGVHKIARGRIDVQRRQRNRDGHDELLGYEVKEVQEVNEVKDFLQASHERGSPSRLSSTSFTSSKWGVAAAGGEWPAAALGLLLPAHGGANHILAVVGGGIVPLSRDPASPCPP